jgi:hypothetical protein
MTIGGALSFRESWLIWELGARTSLRRTSVRATMNRGIRSDCKVQEVLLTALEEEYSGDCA